MRGLLASVLVVLLGCPGCTVIRVEGGEVHRFAGTLRVEPLEGSQLVAVSKRDYGLIADGRNFLLGYGEMQTVIVPEASSCIVVVMPEVGVKDDQAAAWSAFLEKYPDVCVVGGEE